MDPPRSSACPTFSWSAPEGDGAIELVVLAGDPAAPDGAEPVLRRTFPARTSSFTPELGVCLEAGRSYAWAVRARAPEGPGEWSEAAWFLVPTLGGELDGAEPVATTVPERDDRAVAARSESGSPPGGTTRPDEPAADSGERIARGTPPPPDAVAVRGAVADAVGLTAGVHGISASTDAGSAGLLGESTAVSGEVHGVAARVQSPAGIAGVFDNDGGGDVLLGRSSGGEVFRVDGDGDVTATSFAGDGSALTGIDAGTVDGLAATSFLRSDQSDAVTAGTTTFQAGTTLDVDGALDTSGATSLALPSSGISGGGAGSGLDADSLDGQSSGSFLRSNQTDFFTSGTLTFQPGTTLDVDGTFRAVDLELEGRIELPGGDSVLAAPGNQNTAVGRRALQNGTVAGSFNTAVGHDVLRNLTAGQYNTAIGVRALYSPTTTYSNTALGSEVLYANTTGFANTGAGHKALRQTTTGQGNTAVGTYALRQNTTASDNTAVGRYALNRNTAAGNVAVGRSALGENTTGTDNTGIGTRALEESTVGGGNTAVGRSALASNTIGVSSTAVGSFVLTSQTTAYSNTGVGFWALHDTTTGSSNTALGTSALEDNVTGSRNTAVGRYALLANGADDNTAVGAGALGANSSGTSNTGLGSGALAASTTGGSNTAVGRSALTANTSGNNSALGAYALASVSGGTHGRNTAVGSTTMRYGSGADNTAVGFEALFFSSGDGNIAVGAGAGINLTTGDDNIIVGHVGLAGDDGRIRIGTPAVHSETFIAGIRGVTTGNANAIPVLIDSSGQLGTASSSRDTKRDIQPLGDLTERLQDLRPVRFRYRRHGPAGALQFGLIAEEVAEVLPELVVFDDEGRAETVKYHLLGSLLLGEVQRLTTTIRGQRELLERQAVALEEQQHRQVVQEATLREQSAALEALTKRLVVLEDRPPPDRLRLAAGDAETAIRSGERGGDR